MSREELRDEIDNALDLPLAILAIISLVLIIIDLTTVIQPPFLFYTEVIFWFVWSVFVLEYTIKLFVSTDKRLYIRTHWIELAIALVPFLRILRILRIARLTRGVALLRLFLFGHVSIGELEKVLSRRISYLIVLSAVVILIGSTGAYILESTRTGPIQNFGDSLWWAASLVVGTESSDMYPVTTGGRILGVMLLAYSTSIFAFLAASIAAFFIGKGREQK